MGGNLPPRPSDSKNAAPSFVVSALQDAGTDSVKGTPLERIQIVKTWLADGVPHERVYDVATSEVAGELDLDSCGTAGGAAQLCAQWRDPEFDARQRALYYARVLEIPSCRWNVHACHRIHVDCTRTDLPAEVAPCCDPEVPKSIQERAWTSPIWYSPLND
jgi:hypothetical protein